MKKIKLYKVELGQLYSWTQNQIYASKLDLKIVKNTSDKKLAVRLLNRISNDTCKIADYLGALLSANSKLVTQSNENYAVEHSPYEAYQLSLNFMDELNSDRNLYELTKFIHGELKGEQEEAKGLFLKKMIQDFEYRGGLHKNTEQKQEIAETFRQISELQDTLNLQLASVKKEISIPNSILIKFSEVPKKIATTSKLSEDDEKTTLNLSIQQLNVMFLYNDDPEARNFAFEKLSTFNSRSSASIMAEILYLRSRFAKTLGFNSYFDYNIATSSIYAYKYATPSLLQSPQQIETISKEVRTDIDLIKEKILNDLRTCIPKVKVLFTENNPSQNGFKDLLYYRHLLTLRNKSILGNLQWKLGDVIEFLRFFFKKWFDIDIKYTSVKRDDFGKDVRLVEIIANQTGRAIGNIYLDLFSRDGKADSKQTIILQSHSELKMNDDSKVKQRPIMLITSTFKQTDANFLECILNADEVATVCHELGHCMHNFFSRSDYQFVMGTFPIDYAEMMAILSERIAECELYHLLGLQHEELKDVKLQRDLLAPITEFEQLFYALVDLNLHSIDLENTSGSKEEIVNKVFRDVCEDLNRSFGEEIIPAEIQNSTWIFNIDHLLNYGGSYYSYVIATRHADDIIKKVPLFHLGSLAYQADDSDPFYRFKSNLAGLYKTGHSSLFFQNLDKIKNIELD